MADLEAAAAFFADSVQDLHFNDFDLVKRLDGGFDFDLVNATEVVLSEAACKVLEERFLASQNIKEAK